MYKAILTLFVCFCCLFASAQYQGYTPMADEAKFKADFSAATRQAVSIKSDFVQEKNLSMLSEKITSKGKFWFKKESLVRMEYMQPYQYLMIINKDKVYVKDGQKENKISTRNNKMFQQINKVMIDCMQGTTLNNPDFKTRLFENKGTSLIELTPVSKGLKDMFRNIVLIVDKKDYSVVSIQMLEVSGDNTIIRFTNKELNANIPDTLFAIK